jgi:hypothetical protein
MNYLQTEKIHVDVLRPALRARLLADHYPFLGPP